MRIRDTNTEMTSRQPIAPRLSVNRPTLSVSVLSVFVPLLALAQGPVNRVPEEIVYGGDRSFAPYEFLDPSGKPAGLNVDLIRAVARVEGFKVRIRMGPWPEIRAAVAKGGIDVAAMYRSPRRALEVDFAIPHELIYQEMFVRRGSPALFSLADLADKRILVESGTVTIDALEAMGFAPRVRTVPSEPDALRALIRGEGDVAIATQSVSHPFQDRDEFAGKIAVTGPPVLLSEYAFVTRPGRRALIEKLNQGVAAVKASGEYEMLFDRWLRPDKSARRLRWITWVAAGTLALASLALVWNSVLRKHVARQRHQLGRMDTSFRELADYKAEIERANKELEAFAYSVSHDLRAPLRAIDGYTRILLEDYAPRMDEEGRRVCGVIRESVHNMGRLIDDLLNFSRVSRVPMAPAKVDMHALAAEEFRKLQAANVELQLDPLPGAVGDPQLLARVWHNLLSNAVKFSARRDAPTVHVSGAEQHGECVYRVHDNGVGFDARYASKLFSVFQRLHSIREFEGTGVGLAIVQRIVARHGGRVWAESELDRGATFYFTLPEKQA